MYDPLFALHTYKCLLISEFLNYIYRIIVKILRNIIYYILYIIVFEI